MIISEQKQVGKESEQKHLRDDKRRQRRSRKLARRRKPRSHMPTNENSQSELGKYANLAASLEADLNQLGELHRGRDEATRQLQALKATRDRLNQSVLDAEAPQATLLENLRELEGEKLLLEAQLAALEPRVAAHETKLHAQLPLAILCFGRLHGRLVTCIADTARESVTKLLAPGYSVPEDVVSQIAIATPAFVEVSQLKLPGLTHILTRDLEFSQPHWSSLVRPFTLAERLDLRRQTVDCLIAAGKQLCGAAGRLIELAGAYPERVPAFKCEAEVIEPAVVDQRFLEWQQPLGGSDAEFIAAHCKESGRDPNNLSDRDKAILVALVEERHRMPQSHGVLPEGAEMIGTTYQES